MPRGPRLDAPGVLPHVMARAGDRQLLFRDDHDREDFVQRIATLADVRSLIVYAWVLLPNHFHLLAQTGSQPLARSMRSLLTGYAGAFNRRHHRRGHLFQNRYKSIVCEEEAYLLELVRYLHLNPLRAGIVSDLEALARYATVDMPPCSAIRSSRGKKPRRSCCGLLLRYGTHGKSIAPLWRQAWRRGDAQTYKVVASYAVRAGGRRCKYYAADASNMRVTSGSWGGVPLSRAYRRNLRRGR